MNNSSQQQQQQQQQPLINMAEIANLKFRLDKPQRKDEANALNEQETGDRMEIEEEEENNQENVQEDIFDPFNIFISPHIIELYQRGNFFTPTDDGVDGSRDLQIEERRLINDVFFVPPIDYVDEKEKGKKKKKEEEGEEEEEDGKEPLEKQYKQWIETTNNFISLNDESNLRMESMHCLLDYFSRRGRSGNRVLKAESAFTSNNDDDDDDFRNSFVAQQYSSYRKQETYVDVKNIFKRLLSHAQYEKDAKDANINEICSFAPNVLATFKPSFTPNEHALLKIFHQRVSVSVSSTVSPAYHNITVPANNTKSVNSNIGNNETKGDTKKRCLKRPRKEKDKAAVIPTVVTGIGKKQINLLWLSVMSSQLSRDMFERASAMVKEQSKPDATITKNYMRFETPSKISVTSYSVPDASFTVESLVCKHSYKRDPLSTLLADGKGSHTRRGVDTDFMLTAIAEEQMLKLRQIKSGVLTGSDEYPSVLGALSAVTTHKSVVRRLRRFIDEQLAGSERKKLMVHWGKTMTSPCPATEFTILSCVDVAPILIQVMVAGSDYIRCTPQLTPNFIKMNPRQNIKITPGFLEYNVDEFIKLSSPLGEIFKFFKGK